MAPLRAVSPDIVISQVYGGGGNSGATLKNDFIELYNRGSVAVSVDGWSVQYASSSGSSWQTTPLAGVIGPGQYYLVQEAAGSGGTVTLPTPNATGTIAMAATAGKVALVNSATALSGTCPSGVVDFVGFGGANCSETSPTPALTNTTAALRKSNGAQDTDSNAADFTVGTPNPRNTDAAPKVATTVPVDGATSVAPNASITLTFSEAVNVADGWFTVSCSVSGAHTASWAGGPTAFTIDPVSDFVEGDWCTLTVLANRVSDQDTNDPPDTMAANYTAKFAVGDSCETSYTPVYAIQGAGPSVAVAGTVLTRGVVIGDYEGASGLNGFYIQDLTGDGNPATSDGIFVYEPSGADAVKLGDLVALTGSAIEYDGKSEISLSSVKVCGTGRAVTATDVTLPFSSVSDAERYEGMLVRLPQTLTVTDNYDLGRYGEVLLSNGRLLQPTDVTTPGDAALALQALNSLNQIVLDDGSQTQNADPIVFARGGQPLSAANTLRGGDTTTGIVGVFDYSYGAYTVVPVNPYSVNFETVNERPTTPVRRGTLRIAGANLLNYFNTFTGCFAGCRGAENQAEFERQWPKTVDALVKSGADVLGLTEMENDGYLPDSAIQDLVDKLNAATAPGTWAFIDFDKRTGMTKAGGTDAIKSAILYKPSMVTPLEGKTGALNSDAFVKDLGRSPLAQAFRQVSNGEIFVLVVNHFRAKGTCPTDPDVGDGQGGCNTIRRRQAESLANWLATDPTWAGMSNVLLVGDFNAYTQEDPVVALTHAGYQNLVSGPKDYSYVYGGQAGSLDHAFASPGFASMVKLAAPFSINADEPPVLDYNTNFKSTGQVASLYAPDMFRAADHDQLIVDVSLNKAPTVQITGEPITLTQSQTVVLHAAGSDPDGDQLTYQWDLDNDNNFETVGQDVAFSGAGKVGPVTVSVRAIDPLGLSGQDTAQVTVYFDWAGFLPPVKNAPGVNAQKAGSAVPFKFTLGGEQRLDVFRPGFPVSLQVDCTTGVTTGLETATVNPGHSTLSYDSGEYTYVWKTEKAWAGTCRQVTVMLVDGTTHQAMFNFKK